MCTLCVLPPPQATIVVAREQLAFCRQLITEGARAVRANPSPSAEDAHLMADAIAEYFTAQIALEDALVLAAAAVQGRS